MTQMKSGQHITKYVSDECLIKSKEIQKFYNLMLAQQPHYKDFSYLRSCKNTITIKAYNTKLEQFCAMKIAYLKNITSSNNNVNIERLLLEEYDQVQAFSENHYFVQKSNKFYLFDKLKNDALNGDHDNEVINGIKEKTFFVIVMEFIDVSLDEYILKSKLQKSNLSEKQKDNLMIQLLDVLNFLHQKNIIIGCLSPNNLLMTQNQSENENQQLVLKLLNFGQTYYYFKNQDSSNLSFNQKYKEIITQTNQKWEKSMDIFCVGLIILELDNINTFDINRLTVQDYQNGIFSNLGNFYQNKSSNLYIIAQLCLLQDPLQRPSASELLQGLIKMQPDENKIPKIYSLVLENQINLFLSQFKMQNQYILNDFKYIIQELYKKSEYKGYFELIQYNKTQIIFGCKNYQKKKQSVIQVNLIKQNTNNFIYQKEIIQQIQMPLIQQFLGDFNIQIQNKQFYVLEFERSSYSLLDYLKQLKVENILSEEIKFNLVCQLLDAINYAHQKNIIIRNLSIQSFSIFEDDNNIYPNVKLCNLRYAVNEEENDDLSNIHLSDYEKMFLAPELLNEENQIKQCTKESDVFSLGLIILFIDNYLTIESKFQQYSKQLQNPFSEPLQSEQIKTDPINRESKLYRVIKQIVIYNQQQRKSLEQIVNAIQSFEFFSKKAKESQTNYDQNSQQIEQQIPKNFRKQNKIFVKYHGEQVLIEFKLKDDQIQQIILDKSHESLQIIFENMMIKDLSNMWEAIVQCRNMKNLSLNFNQTLITRNILGGMPEAFRWWFYNLQEFLFLFENNNAEDEVLLILSESLKHLKNLQSLKLKFSHNQITDTSFQVFCKSLEDYRQLNEILLDFSFNQLTDQSLQNLKNIILNNKNLSMIHLSFIKNKITGSCLEIFKHLKECEYLKIVELDFTGNKIEDKGFLGVCEIVKLQNLHTLNLIFNNTYLQESHLLKLCYSFSESYCIKNLQLRFSYTQATEIVQMTFSKVFQSLQDIESILFSMSNNQIQDKGLIEICKSFKQLNKIKDIQLNFGYNQLTLDGIHTACSELNQCNFLENIALDLVENDVNKLNSKLTINKVKQQIHSMFVNKKFKINM